MNLGKLVALGVATLVVAGGTAAAIAVAGSERGSRDDTTIARGADSRAKSGFECPITAPPTPAFVAPEPHPAKPSDAGMVWYGTESLWTALPTEGSYSPRKSVWWSSSFGGGRLEPEPEIEVVWERLDADLPPITNKGRGTNAHTPMTAGLSSRELILTSRAAGE